jgi:hypothetical protein
VSRNPKHEQRCADVYGEFYQQDERLQKRLELGGKDKIHHKYRNHKH